MAIQFKNGSTWQLCGSDSYDALTGSTPAMIVYSEWALSDPNAWSYTRPILREADGVALFISTPRGANHYKSFVESHREADDWFVEILPATETDVFTPQELDRERQELIEERGQEEGEALFNQEYLVDFNSAMLGSYFGREMSIAEQQGRIGHVAYDPRFPCWSAWDIGINDATSCWILQIIGQEIRAIDYFESSGVGLDYYVRQLKDRPYVYEGHIFPHDISVRELGTGLSRLETLYSLGLSNIRIVPAQNVADGINATRVTLPFMWFDRQKCKQGIACLQNYCRHYDEKRRTYSDHPYRNWATHGADALRMFCLANPRNRVRREIKYSNAGII